MPSPPVGGNVQCAHMHEMHRFSNERKGASAGEFWDGMVLNQRANGWAEIQYGHGG